MNTPLCTNAMNLPGQVESGRARQKRRSRRLLLQTAAEMIGRGKVTTVTAVPAPPRFRTAPPTATSRLRSSFGRSRLGATPARVRQIVESAQRRFDAATVLEYTVGQIQLLIVKHEALLRTIVRLSLDRKLGDSAPVRGRRRVDWIESAMRDDERCVSALSPLPRSRTPRHPPGHPRTRLRAIHRRLPLGRPRRPRNRLARIRART